MAYERTQKKGLTLKQMGEKLDISESYYHMIEKSERQKSMDITLVAKISNALDIPINLIIANERDASAN